MKYLLLTCRMIIGCLFTCQTSAAQVDIVLDSLLNELNISHTDTDRVNRLIDLNVYLRGAKNNPDAIQYAEEALRISEKINFNKGIARSYECLSWCSLFQGKHEEALRYLKSALKIAEKEGNQREIAFCYNKIGIIYSQMGNYIEAVNNIQTALTICEAMRDKKAVSKSYYVLGHVYCEQANYPEAVKNHLIAVKLLEEIGKSDDRITIANWYSHIGSIYLSLGNYAEGIKNFLAALKIREEIGDKLGMGWSNQNIGLIYVQIHNYPEALKFEHAALRIFEELDCKKCMASPYGTIGYIHLEEANYDEALHYFQLALPLFKENNNISEIANCYNNIAEIYRIKKMSAEAIVNYTEALTINKNKNNYVAAETYMDLGRVYFETGDYIKAEEYLNKGLLIAQEIGHKQLIKNGYDYLAELHNQIGNYKQALLYHKLFMTYKDSLLNDTISQQISQLKEQYESEKKDKEILQLTMKNQLLEGEKQLSVLMLKTKQDSLFFITANQRRILLENQNAMQQIVLLNNEKLLQDCQIENDQVLYAVEKAEAGKRQEELVVLQQEKSIQQLQLKKQKLTKNYFLAGLFLVSILSVVVYQNYRTRHELKMETLRNKIARDLHDDIGSTLSSISIFSQVAKKQTKEVLPALETIDESSRKMLDAMADIVWTINPDNDQLDKVIMRMRGFAFDLLGAKGIDFVFKADDHATRTKLSMEERRNLYLIFKEATNNMVKYAEASKAKFTLKEEGEKLTMTISDNGIGFDPSLSSKGNGLKNMYRRAAEMGGKLLIDSKPGEGTTIRFELAI